MTLENEQREAARLLADAHERLEFALDLLAIARSASSNAAQLAAIGAERLSFGAINSLNYRDLQLALQRARVQELTAIQAARAAATDIERLRGALVAASPL